MAEPDGIDRFISDLIAHVTPDSYDGTDGSFCLVGQLSAYLDDLIPEGWSATVRIASYYSLPERAVEAVYAISAHQAFRNDLDAAIWMADYVLRQWTPAVERQYLVMVGDLGDDVEQAFLAAGES